MSVEVKRRIKLRKKYRDDETPSKFSVTSDKIKKQKTDFSCAIDFNSETLSSSSPIKDVSSEKRFRKKKIRSTQDFNNLDSSLTSQDSEMSTKNNSKKTKKRNRVYKLPRISNLSANSHTLNNQKDSDEEIVIKQRRRKKKRPSASGSNADVDKEKPNTFEKYAKRIKHLLSDSVSRSSKSSNTSNVSTPLSNKKNEETPTNKAMNTKQISNATTPKADTSMMHHCDNLDKSKKQSISARSSRRIICTPHPKSKLSNDSYDDVKKRHTQSVIIRRSKAKLSANFLPEGETKNKRRTRNSSHLTLNVSFDMDFGSDDVFNNTSENKIKNQTSESTQEENIKNDVSLKNYSIKTRKSVRFQSPEQNIRRETLILSKRSSHNIKLTPKPDECSNDIISPNSFSEGYRSSNGGTKRNSTFDISPKITQLDFCQDVSQNEILINNSTLQKFNTPYKNCEGNTSKRRSKLSMSNAVKRKCSSELLFPVNKTRSMSGVGKIDDSLLANSVIDLTIPTPLKRIKSCVLPSTEKLTNSDVNDVSKPLNRRSTFSKDDEESDSTIKHTEATQTEVINISPVPKLVRTATFTKDDETIEHQVDFQYSPLPSNNSYCKPLDTSKVNKRRRWDKSRASVSFLDNSLDIGNISAPWQENDSIKLLNDSDANRHKQSLEVKSNSKIDSHKNKVSPKSQSSPPSGTSTPFPKRKSNLLKQALLKDKRDVPANENKNCSVNVEKPPLKVVRTKIPNFALIHQRALDKLENIKEMSERKAARAKILLSGRKPPSEDIPKSSTKRKELKFSPVHLKSSSFNENKNINTSLNHSNISVSKIKKISPSKSNVKVTNKENRLAPIEKKKELLKAKSQLPKPKCNTVVAEKKGYTRFGFKMSSNVKKATKDEQVKAVTTKSKIMTNTLEQRRNLIQGVRSNRRFELLMNMRMK